MTKIGFVLILFTMLAFHAAHGMDCSLGQSNNMFEKAISRCPGLLDSSDMSYCCWNKNLEHYHCCTFIEFATSSPMFPIVVVGLVVLLIVACICCVCCTCCCLCKRNNKGRVLVPSPMVLTVGPGGHTIPPNVPYQPLSSTNGHGMNEI